MAAQLRRQKHPVENCIGTEGLDAWADNLPYGGCLPPRCSLAFPAYLQMLQTCYTGYGVNVL